MTQFYEGQEVEVRKPVARPKGFTAWRKAKIIGRSSWDEIQVQLLDGTKTVIDANHIRPTK